MKNQLVDSDLLGKAIVPDQGFVNPDGSDLVIDKDYFGKERILKNPLPGPFSSKAEQMIPLKAWPKE
jgi:hypothetical protein